MKKVSEWLNELGTHQILIVNMTNEDFIEETGESPCWGEGFSRKQMQQQIEDRGKGGSLGGVNDGKKLIGSLDVAAACYDKYRGDEMADAKFGMGSQFREYVDAISRNGK